MAFIVTTKEKMVEMIDYYIDCLRSEGAQMLILPAMDCDTPVDVEDCLAETVQYTALATRSFGAHGGLKVGELKVFSERTVADAIREMEGGSTKSFDLVIKAMKAALPVKTDADLQAVCTAIEAGTAFVVDFEDEGEFDKDKFAAATGLPTEGKTSREFSVFRIPSRSGTLSSPCSRATKDLLLPAKTYFRNTSPASESVLLSTSTMGLLCPNSKLAGISWRSRSSSTCCATTQRLRLRHWGPER